MLSRFQALLPAAATNSMLLALALLISSRSACENPPPPQLFESTRTLAAAPKLALASSPASEAASVGYAGTASDGLTQLDAARALTSYTDAPDGHIVATEALTPDRKGQLTLALGFGRTQSGAISTASSSLGRRSFIPATSSRTGPPIVRWYIHRM